MIDPKIASTVNTTPPKIGVAAVIGLMVAVVALSLPDVTGDPNAGNMTHYMGLLGSNQPWNVLLFMAPPVTLGEIIAVSELQVLLEQREGCKPHWVQQLNRLAGILLGPWFFGITIYLLKNAVVPLTLNGMWHGPIDLIAVGFYLSSVFPLVGITLIELDILGRSSAHNRMRLHAIFVGIFLIVVHVAMVSGMFDPKQWGWTPGDSHVGMPGMR